MSKQVLFDAAVSVISSGKLKFSEDNFRSVFASLQRLQSELVDGVQPPEHEAAPKKSRKKSRVPKQATPFQL